MAGRPSTHLIKVSVWRLDLCDSDRDKHDEIDLVSERYRSYSQSIVLIGNNLVVNRPIGRYYPGDESKDPDREEWGFERIREYRFERPNRILCPCKASFG